MLNHIRFFAVVLLIGFAVSTASAFENIKGSIVLSNSTDVAGQLPPPPPSGK